MSCPRFLLPLTLLLCPFLSQAADARDPADKLKPVGHIMVIYLENHSFDNLFGGFPGADGIANAGGKAAQTDADGHPYEVLPRAMDGAKPDPRFPDKLPNKPFPITDYVRANERTGDLVHRFYQLQEQIDQGKMDHFALVSNAGGLVMGYYGAQGMPLWDYAKRYTLADHFFTGAFGGSMLNHFVLVCACVPRYENAPAGLHAVLDGNGKLLKDGSLTPDGYAVNTIQPFAAASADKPAEDAMRLPPSLLPTIGERLNEKHIGWAWYSGGWNDANSGHPDKLFMTHHQPFVYFAAYGPGTQARREHLRDESEFLKALDSGTLPPVSFYKPIGANDLHPDYSRPEQGEEHISRLLRKIEQSPLFKDSVIIVTFDDAGGWWDHVAPPHGDRFGPGERIPTMIISPFARKGFVDHTTYDTTSILKLIETKYGLKPLGTRDANAGDLTNALE